MSSSRAKSPVDQQIRYVGLSELTPEERDAVQDIVEAEFEKRIRRYTKNQTSLVIQIKAYQKKKDGKGEDKSKKKYQISMKVIAPGATFVENKAVDWDLVRCLRQAFNNVQKMIISRYKDDVSYKKTYV